MKHTRNSFALFGAAALAFAAGGCGKTASAGGGDPASITNAITADAKAMNDQTKSNDLEGLVGHYADDAYFAAEGNKPADGSTEIRQLWSGALSDKAFKLSFASDKVDAGQGGDLAYSRGHFTRQYTDPKSGKVMADSGSYVAVYKTQADGSWKVVEDFAVADPNSVKAVPPGKAVTSAKMVSF